MLPLEQDNVVVVGMGMEPTQVGMGMTPIRMELIIPTYYCDVIESTTDL